MADAITGKTQVSATIQDLVSAQIQMVLNANLIVPGTVTEVPAGPGQQSVKVPRFGKFTVATKAAGTPVDAQQNAFSTDQLNLDQYKAIQFLVEDIAQLQSNVAIMQAYIEQAGKDLATDVDAYCITQLVATSASAPDHRLAYAGASIAKADILGARSLLNVQNVPLSDRSLIISPASESSLLSIQEFTKVNEAGGGAALRNGQIGDLFGFKVFMSSLVADAATVAYHKSHVGFSRQMAPKVEYFRDVPNLADRYSISHIFGAKTLDSGKRGVLLGSAT